MKSTPFKNIIKLGSPEQSKVKEYKPEEFHAEVYNEYAKLDLFIREKRSQGVIDAQQKLCEAVKKEYM